MKYVVYFVPREGIHPYAKLADYDELWPIMLKSVHGIGASIVHLTDMSTESRGDEVFRVDVDPATTMFSRDVAWRTYLASLGDDEQACMIEPDTYMLKQVPPISPGYDMVLLRRPQKCIPGWFKLGTKRSVPFYDRVLHEWESIHGDLRVFHGDIAAIHRACGIPDGVKAHTIPGEVAGVKIEVREWLRYGFRKAPDSDPFFLQFKGTSKSDMLKLA